MNYIHSDPLFEPAAIPATEDILSLMNQTGSSLGLDDDLDITAVFSAPHSLDGDANILPPIQFGAYGIYDQVLLPSEAGLPSVPLHEDEWILNMAMMFGPAPT